jgi:divalent metal cation (Fe/Co/Zn/Cd) transporter
MAAHLRTDAGASLWITFAAVATSLVDTPTWNIAAAVVILWLAFKHNWHIAMESAGDVHRKANCPG